MKKLKVILSVALLCLFFVPFQVAAQEQEREKIKVGYTNYFNFIEKSPDGEYEGYGVDYLEEIGRYTGWEYEFIYYDWSTALQKLKNSEIDILCNATQSAENKANYEFSRHPIGAEQFVLYCLPKTDLFGDDFENLEGKNIGILSQSANVYSFDEYAVRNGFSYNKKEFESDEELKAALYAGVIDAIATVHLAPYEDLKLIGKYGSNPIHIITSKNSPIYSDLNSALGVIKADKPSFDGDLYAKHYGKSLAAIQPMFTRQEMEFVKNNPNIKMGIWSDRIPISYVDPVSQRPKGINKALMDEVGKISGIRFEYIPLPESVALVDALDAGAADLVCGPPNLGDFLKNKGLQTSRPYYTSKLVFVSNGVGLNFNVDLKIVMPKTTKAINDYVIKAYPNFTIVYSDTIYDSLKMVASGEADITLCNEYLVSYYLQKPAFSKLFALTNYSVDDAAVIIGTENTDPVLMSVINKSISVMDAGRTEKVVIAQIANTNYKMTLDDFLYQYGAIVLVVVLVGTIWIYLISVISIGRKKNSDMLKKINEELSLEQKRYELVLSQTNDIIFEWNYKTKNIEHSTNFLAYLGREPDGRNFPHNIETINNVHPDDYDACVEMYSSYDNGALCAVGEFRLKNKENKYTWYRSRSTAVLDEKGNIVKVLGMLSDINSEKRKLIAVENQARKDNLTGIYNRKAAEELISEYIENEVRGALFMIDIDNFKAINDTYGHQIGDEVLSAVADELTRLFRAGDVVARLGGDEFMVFMADISESYDIGYRAKELVKTIDEIDNANTKISVSVGVSFYPQNGNNFVSLYQKADSALYDAKKNGKNQYAFWEG